MTSRADQSEILVRIVQGESNTASRNHQLGDFRVRDIPPGPRGSQKIVAKVAVTCDGLLRVTTTKMHNGQVQDFEIEPDRAGGLTEEMVQHMI